MTKTALIVIDVQNYFINEHTKNIPEKIAQFIGKNKFDFVLFTKFVNHEGSNYFKLLNWKKCLGSPDTDIHPALEKFVNESNLFEKTSYSIFKSRKLVDFLEQNKITKLYLCGIDIDACVLASSFEAFDFGYDVEVLADLSLSHSGKQLDNAALEIIKKNLAKKEFAAKEQNQL
ncbi:cysteine hydrolase [Candidatus Roizmanbacteria bacterium]|nr:cysteine hydrolase [Candidatus Roizmanbacteria bacterium]